jgi:hypothetical protein
MEHTPARLNFQLHVAWRDFGCTTSYNAALGSMPSPRMALVSHMAYLRSVNLKLLTGPNADESPQKFVRDCVNALGRHRFLTTSDCSVQMSTELRLVHH